MGRGRRPPRRTCGECGGDYYGWREHDRCPTCKRSDLNAPAEDSIVAMLREQRLERRARRQRGEI